MCFKPKYIHFVYSYAAYVAFPYCVRREDQLVVFSLYFPLLEEHGDIYVVVMVNNPFSDLPFFLILKNLYDLR